MNNGDGLFDEMGIANRKRIPIPNNSVALATFQSKLKRAVITLRSESGEQKMGLAAAFGHYSVQTVNPRQSWSARSADGKTVVMTLWKDILDYSAKPVVYNTFGKEADFVEASFGNRERIENLKWARDHCDGQFRVVITVAKDVTAKKREIAECFPQDQMTMRLKKMDELTGEFFAEMQ